MTPFAWTDDRITAMRNMLAEGHSTAAVAAALGVSRNAVIGKVMRLEQSTNERWARRTGTTHGPRKVQLRATDTKTVPKIDRNLDRAPSAPTANVLPLIKPLPAMKPTPKPAVAYVPGKAAGILDVTGCRWAVGERADVIGKHVFCNARKAGGTEYCAFHDQAKSAPYSEKLVKKTLRAFGMRFEKRRAG